jgi:hypothetical protein
MNQFVTFTTFALFLFLVTLVNSVPLIMNKRQFAMPVLLLTDQQSLNTANEAANSNRLDVSASNDNQYANSYSYDQAGNLVVNKRNVIPYVEFNVPNSHFTVKRDSNVEEEKFLHWD